MDEHAHDIGARIERYLAHAYDEPRSIDDEYQGQFAAEGRRKAANVIDDIRRLEADGLIDSSKWAVVSVGGADGSDLRSILARTRICHGVLLEYSVAAARESALLNAYLPPGKKIDVLPGDAGQRSNEAVSILQRLKTEGGFEGAVLILFSILHELPNRSPNFQTDRFLSRLYGVFENRLLYLAEPTEPSIWPEIVEIRVGNATSSQLVRFSRLIWDRLFTGVDIIKPTALDEGWVRLSRVLEPDPKGCCARLI